MRKKLEPNRVLKAILKNAPELKGYSIKQLSEIAGMPWSTTRWHLDISEAHGEVKHFNIGKAKIYQLIEEEYQKKNNSTYIC